MPEPATDPNNPDFISESWQNLPWSPWVPFDAPKEFWYIPREPGLYRIRAVDRDTLMYIGETGRPLDGRLNDLRLGLRRTDLMPWSDPHAEAPVLWAWRDADGYEYECSATPFDATPAGRRAMEGFLLYRYRQESGGSPPCNFGRFHPRYRKSTTKKENRRGGKLSDSQKDNPAGWPGMPPLPPTGKPGEPDWMDLEWSESALLTTENVQGVLPGAGLYYLADPDTLEILFIGHAADIAKRLSEHSIKEREDQKFRFSYQVIGQNVLPHNILELETDLLGNFYEQFGKAPEFQFRGSHHR